MGTTGKTDPKLRRRPGAVQVTFVVLVCLTLMTCSAYAGFMLLTGQSIGFDIHWLEEEIRRHLN